MGIHLGERFKASDIARTLGDRKFLLPSNFKGRNANVAVTAERIEELREALAL